MALQILHCTYEDGLKKIIGWLQNKHILGEQFRIFKSTTDILKRPGKLRKGVLFHQDNAPAHKPVVTIAAARDCGLELVDHPQYSPDLAPYMFSSPNMKKILCLEAVSDRSWGHMCSSGLFRRPGWELLNHGVPSAATTMEDVCGPQGRLCWKINYIWSSSTIAS